MSSTSEDDKLRHLEHETRRSAVDQVAKILQRPDQLERVDQLKKRYNRKKAVADAHLKAAVQSQLDGVKTGLSQLRSCLDDVTVVKSSLNDIHTIYDSVSSLTEKLKELSRENANHHQLHSAIESFKCVQNVPQLVSQARKDISEGNLLIAHRHLADLEASRDQLLLELHRTKLKLSESEAEQQYENETKLLQGYFKDVQKCSEEMSKQISLALSRTLLTVKQKPEVIVTAVRIIERECRLDDDWAKRYEQYGYLPSDRPKRWREKAISTLTDAVMQKVEGCQLEERSEHKMWLVRHLEVIRRNTIEDLKVVKSLCEPCFPKEYDIVRTYVKLYHTAISQHLINLKDQGLEGNEIISLLNWITMYYTEEFMGHRGLQIREGDLGPLLAQDVIEELQQQYLNTLRKNIAEWMTNSMSTDKKDWDSNQEPESDGSGYFVTQLPVLVFQIVEQNMQVAQLLGTDIIPKVLDLVLSEISVFADLYKEELTAFKTAHARDRSQPFFYLQYMIANINNCDKLSELTKQLKDKYVENPSEDRTYAFRDHDRYNTITKQFLSVADIGLIFVKEEIFEDIGKYVNNIMTSDWLKTENDIGTICITVEDYHHDLLHLRGNHYQELMKRLFEQILIGYLRQLLSPSRKITFKSPDERKEAALKICTESDQLVGLFRQLNPEIRIQERDTRLLAKLAEVIELGDTETLGLVLGGVLLDYPDAKKDHMVNLLMLRNDLNRSEAQQKVNDLYGENSGLGGGEKSILSKV